jgi:hypothetical protein
LSGVNPEHKPMMRERSTTCCAVEPARINPWKFESSRPHHQLLTIQAGGPKPPIFVFLDGRGVSRALSKINGKLVCRAYRIAVDF